MNKPNIHLHKPPKPNIKPSVVQRFKSIVKCIVRDMSDPFYLNISPGLAYYFLLSTAPVVLLFNYMVNLFFSGTNLIVSLMRSYLPAQISSILIPFFSQQNRSSGLFATLIFFAITLYLSTRGMYTLIKVADYATDNLIQAHMRDVPMAMFRRFMKSLALTLLLILLVVLSLVFFVFGRTLLDIWVSHVEVGLLSDVIYHAYRLFALPVVMALSFLILTFIYSRMPATTLPYREVLPGSITATIGIMVASIAYLIYLRFFFRLDAIFGALTSIIVLILWFFMMSFMLVFGILVNVAFRDTRPEPTVEIGKLAEKAETGGTPVEPIPSTETNENEPETPDIPDTTE